MSSLKVQMFDLGVDERVYRKFFFMHIIITLSTNNDSRIARFTNYSPDCLRHVVPRMSGDVRLVLQSEYYGEMLCHNEIPLPSSIEPAVSRVPPWKYKITFGSDV